MELTPEMLEAGRKAYEQALVDGGDPIAAALDSALVEVLSAIKSDKNKPWTQLEALVVYSECIRPKTYHLYDDALKLTVGKFGDYNLFQLMSMLVSQTVADLYTTILNMGMQEKYPTERAFREWFFERTQEEYDKADRRQSIIDSLKPPPQGD